MTLRELIHPARTTSPAAARVLQQRGTQDPAMMAISNKQRRLAAMVNHPSFRSTTVRR